VYEIDDFLFSSSQSNVDAVLMEKSIELEEAVSSWAGSNEGQWADLIPIVRKEHPPSAFSLYV